MRTLVFGQSGQVARALADVAQRDGLDMTFASRAQVDLTDADACAALIANGDMDVVINAAAYTAVDRAEEEPELAYAVNATAPGAMAARPSWRARMRCVPQAVCMRLCALRGSSPRRGRIL